MHHMILSFLQKKNIVQWIAKRIYENKKRICQKKTLQDKEK